MARSMICSAGGVFHVIDELLKAAKGEITARTALPPQPDCASLWSVNRHDHSPDALMIWPPMRVAVAPGKH